jgi:hypothetical protein
MDQNFFEIDELFYFEDYGFHYKPIQVGVVLLIAKIYVEASIQKSFASNLSIFTNFGCDCDLS